MYPVLSRPYFGLVPGVGSFVAEVKMNKNITIVLAERQLKMGACEGKSAFPSTSGLEAFSANEMSTWHLIRNRGFFGSGY